MCSNLEQGVILYTCFSILMGFFFSTPDVCKCVECKNGSPGPRCVHHHKSPSISGHHYHWDSLPLHW